MPKEARPRFLQMPQGAKGICFAFKERKCHRGSSPSAAGSSRLASLGVAGSTRWRRFCGYGRNLWRSFSQLLLVKSGLGDRALVSVLARFLSEYVAFFSCGRLSPGSSWTGISESHQFHRAMQCSWKKTAGGETMSWVGFELLHRIYKNGLPERRARWTREAANAGYVHMSAFEGGLGRVMYVAGALEFERPFLSPLYRFITLHLRVCSSSPCICGIYSLVSRRSDTRISPLRLRSSTRVIELRAAC